jgi:hypothetical protein
MCVCGGCSIVESTGVGASLIPLDLNEHVMVCCVVLLMFGGEFVMKRMRAMGPRKGFKL